jgi:hypothetical protein
MRKLLLATVAVLALAGSAHAMANRVPGILSVGLNR